MYTHVPVLLKEVLAYLDPKPSQNFVDGTLGGAGYTKALLESSGPDGQVLAIDLDDVALNNAKDQLASFQKRIILAHGNFRDIDKIVVNHNFGPISGIVADIGLSSFQLDESGRGISFQKKELLDMRFDASSNQPDARFLLKHRTAEELTEIFEKYGEDKNSYKIARSIVRYRETDELKYTDELVQIIQDTLSKPEKHRFADTARRIFQALRIEVNQELANLEAFLPKAFDLLSTNGKLVVVTFHSLEDRIVKNFFKELATGCVCPKEFPICKCGQIPKGKILTKKIVTATESELAENTRSKSAKLRAIQKI